jgi:LysM repeat protein
MATNKEVIEVPDEDESVVFIEEVPSDVDLSAAPARKTSRTHTVKTGDTYTSIEAKYGVRFKEIAKANDIKHNYLSVGEKLTIPANR